MSFLRRLLLLLAVLPALADDPGGAPAGEPPGDDGPYVFLRAGAEQAVWLCDGEVRRQPLPPSRLLVPPCGALGRLAVNAADAPAPDRLPAPVRWAAVSDIHGQAGLLLTLLARHGIVDEHGDWAWGEGVLVIAGDVFDRGPTVNEALWSLYRLAQQARAAGGAVHALLGNHETMVLAGDLRYIHPRYRAVAERLGETYSGLYGADTALGRWLRSRATVLKLGDTVFLHGGLHPALAAQPIDLAAINAGIRAGLGLSRQALAADPAAAALFGRDGPLWYRGYFLAPRATAAEIDALLARLGAQRIVVGHTTQAEVRSLYGGKVVGIDAGLKDGERGELLLWDNGQLWRGLSDGRRLPLPAGADDGSGAIEMD
ncbi:metallophosphoesterase [Chitinimonas koreensis]|uniref:metallophosphoesterase n=1 Tax=Chitinimonas koreensis TaxID=356302 RepID=UPI00040DCB6D|nr:metallophosphoesterase [Chitinimonas koreensis]QNM96662.1 metallophosphoesterase [Chitinimonas koreensis]